jgi:hypothetical protein
MDLLLCEVTGYLTLHFDIVRGIIIPNVPSRNAQNLPDMMVCAWRVIQNCSANLHGSTARSPKMERNVGVNYTHIRCADIMQIG